jgi:hypothetical protein
MRNEQHVVALVSGGETVLSGHGSILYGRSTV